MSDSGGEILLKHVTEIFFLLLNFSPTTIELARGSRIGRFSFSITKIRYDSKFQKTIISIVPEIICPKILFLQTFVFHTLQEHFVFIEKKRKMCVIFMV